MHRRTPRTLRLLKWIVPLALAPAATVAVAQQPAEAPHDHRQFACNPEDLSRGSATGCQRLAQIKLTDRGPAPLFWHLATFTSRRDAEAAKRGDDTIVEAEGKVWLLRFGARGDSLATGKHLATMGPLPMPTASSYQVELFQVLMPPGMHTVVHTHPGPEAWYVLEGEQCLETPVGVIRARAGEGAIAPPGGTPMQLTNNGTRLRRALFIVIHDPVLPYTARSDWQPPGACDRPG